MAAYSLAERFKTPKDCSRLLDPTAYDAKKGPINPKQNKYPFLSATARKTLVGNKSYTDALYYADIKPTIPNITSLKSKRPRFPYESFSLKDLKDLLCRCGFEDPCECATEDGQPEEVLCQANVRKRLFKGVPHSALSDGLSRSSKKNLGYEIWSDGSTRRIVDEVGDECPPFYDARVNELTQFYRGWKWSKWTSQRAPKSLEVRPGPADYTLQKSKTQYDVCAERLRAKRRGKSKQPRYIEMIQERQIREGYPGPAHYTPISPKGADFNFFGPKAERFPVSEYDKRPAPCAYFIKRTFDLPEPPKQQCLAKLVEPSCFGVKAPRFRYKVIEGPGPAEYNVGVKLYKIQHCSRAPFGVSANRFKDDFQNEDGEETAEEGEQQETRNVCLSPTWQFRSKTSRFKASTVFDPNIPKIIEHVCQRSPRTQYLSPFNSSEGRFQPWKDWMPVYGAEKTPGPGYYNLEKPKCLPAVFCGPLYRAKRFTERKFLTPAANEFIVGGGVETVLATHNERLKQCIKNKYQFNRKHLTKSRKYSLKERELMLLDKAIAQLEIEELPNKEHRTRTEASKGSSVIGDRLASENDQFGKENTLNLNKVKKSSKEVVSEPKQKLLRTFLYQHPQPIYF